MNDDLVSVYNQPFSVAFDVYEGEGIVSGTVDNEKWEFLNHKKLLRLEVPGLQTLCNLSNPGLGDHKAHCPPATP